MTGQWLLATDIGARIRALRELMGWSQGEFGALLGRRYQQVSSWENGRQRPPRGALERLATSRNWPTEIFAEGGPMPSTVIRPGDALVTGAGDTEGSPPAELAHMIARDVGLAIARAVTQAHLDQSRAGIERLADTLLTLAVLFGENGDDNTEILRAVQRLRALNAAG